MKGGAYFSCELSSRKKKKKRRELSSFYAEEAESPVSWRVRHPLIWFRQGKEAISSWRTLKGAILCGEQKKREEGGGVRMLLFNARAL